MGFAFLGRAVSSICIEDITIPEINVCQDVNHLNKSISIKPIDCIINSRKALNINKERDMAKAIF